ncbi:MAG: hypothetical protein B6I30_00075 [Desulfobacteraceae bacterium 4572_187]|nr:MAG: hypothetical protein B6I30_00075 [Desulfobacteraceae bacterium 4572_187]
MSAKSKPVKVYIFRFLILPISIIILIELLLRLFLYLSLNTYLNNHIPDLYRENMARVVLGPTPYEFDPICYYLPKDGLFRGPNGQTSYPQDKNRDEVRIICAGDSTTYGLAVGYDKSYPYLLQSLLRKKFPQKDIRVLNAGYPGASERQIKRIFQFHLVKYHPDIIIFRKELFHLSDSYDVPQNSNIVRYFLWRCLYESRIFRAICVMTQERYQGYPLFLRAYDFIMYKFSGLDKSLPNDFDSDFSIIKKIASEHGIRYVAAVDFVRLTAQNELINDCLQYSEKDLHPVICTRKSFETELEKVSSGEVFVDVEHLTEIGTSIIAQEVYQFLLDEKWLGFGSD